MKIRTPFGICRSRESHHFSRSNYEHEVTGIQTATSAPKNIAPIYRYRSWQHFRIDIRAAWWSEWAQPPANMKTTFVSPAAKKVNWSRLPDRLTEGEVEFSITAWTANARTIAALERQAKRDGYKSVFEYLNVTITAMLLSDEETTLLADDGRIMHKGFGWDGGYPKDV